MCPLSARQMNLGSARDPSYGNARALKSPGHVRRQGQLRVMTCPLDSARTELNRAFRFWKKHRINALRSEICQYSPWGFGLVSIRSVLATRLIISEAAFRTLYKQRKLVEVKGATELSS
jgi:hypothetical protein